MSRGERYRPARTRSWSGKDFINRGNVVDLAVAVVIIAFAVFLVVKAINAAQGDVEDDEAGPSETDLLAEIRDELKAQRN